MEKKPKITVTEALPRPENKSFPKDLLTKENPLADAVVNQFQKRFASSQIKYGDNPLKMVKNLNEDGSVDYKLVPADQD